MKRVPNQFSLVNAAPRGVRNAALEAMETQKKPKHRFWRGKVLPKLLLTFVPLPKNTFCSIDATSKCNLRCAHCYFFSYEQEQSPELSVEEWLARIEKMQKGRGAFFSCTWVGGEPLLRRELIEKGRRFFRSNRVVTNGTLPLPDWPDVEFHVSVDGTEKLHDAIRGEGCYAKIKKNISDPAASNLNVAIACCLNRKNVGCVEELLTEWKRVPNVRHVLFDFFTPIKGEDKPCVIASPTGVIARSEATKQSRPTATPDSDLWLTFPERDQVLDRLEELKKTYGSFIGGPPLTFTLMREKNRHRAIGRACVFLNNGTAFDAWGNVKKPCVIGPRADCDKCGCIVPFSVKAWKHPSNLLREVWRDLRTVISDQ